MNESTTKIYQNNNDKPVNIIGVGEVAAHDRVSVTTAFHAPVNLANYPDVIEVVSEEAAGNPVDVPSPNTDAPKDQPGITSTLKTEKTEGQPNE